MLAPYPSFVGPTYRSQSPIADCEICRNWYPEPMQAGGAKPKTPPMALYPTPGVHPIPFALSTFSPNRGMMEQDGRSFAIIGPTFNEINADGTLTVHGTVDVDTHPATMVSSGDGGNQILISSGGNAYVFDLTTLAFTLIVGPWFTANFTGFLSGRFLILDATSSAIWASDLYDGLTWQGDMFRQRSLASDRWLAMAVTRSNIWLIGSQSYEVWNDIGTYPFPFAPIQGALFPTGIHAPYSISKLGDMVAWLSGSSDGAGEVVIGVQYAPETISDYGIAFKIQQAKRDGLDISDAESMVYQEDGHTFMVMTFRAANFTISYDLSTKMWHERSYLNPLTGVEDASRQLYHAFSFGYHLVGDRSTGAIYKAGIDQFSDVAGTEIRRVRRAPHLDSMLHTVFFSQLRLDVQTGVGARASTLGELPDHATNSPIPVGQGSDPLIMLRWSDDGGQTWGNEITCSVGAKGKYRTDVWFNQLGSSRDRVFEIATSDPVAWRIIAAYIDAEAGTF